MPKVNEKQRTNFKNVEIKLPHNSDYKYEYRPIVEQVERLNRLSDEIKANPKTVVNFLIDVGLECFERSIPRLKQEINKQLEKKIKGLLK